MAPYKDPALKEQAESSVKENPSALGDPVSLKSENSDTEPTEKDRPNKQASQGDGKKKSLKEMAESNPTMLGDPVSLKAETSDTEPTKDDRGARGTGDGKGDGDESRRKRESKM